MTDREKLIQIIDSSRTYVADKENLAEHLIENGVTVQKWIPVSERLPNWKDGKVLVSTKYGFSICERTVNGRWKGQHANWITHWMPMPGGAFGCLKRLKIGKLSVMI